MNTLDTDRRDMVEALAQRLAALYETPFAGKERGRYRLSMKHLRRLTGQRRVYPETIAALTRALYERGYVLVDMESYFAILSQRTFSSYRRLNDSALERLT